MSFNFDIIAGKFGIVRCCGVAGNSGGLVANKVGGYGSAIFTYIYVHYKPLYYLAVIGLVFAISIVVAAGDGMLLLLLLISLLMSVDITDIVCWLVSFIPTNFTNVFDVG